MKILKITNIDFNLKFLRFDNYWFQIEITKKNPKHCIIKTRRKNQERYKFNSCICVSIVVFSAEVDDPIWMLWFVVSER